MAGTSDKARFYLEQSVPELREWERREIFTKGEIAAITAKRSDFEHVLNARGSKPSDYARYAEYEMNVDALRRKRVLRKGVKATAYTGQRRIFSILERATKKFHGDIGLWIQYLDFARKQKANKKMNRILTDVLRMHPTKAELWVYAAYYAIQVHADIAAARSYMQRGLRFCPQNKVMFLEYARLELSYIAKIAGRQNILGLDAIDNQAEKSTAALDDTNADVIILPQIVPHDSDLEDLDGDEEAVLETTADSKALEALAATPVMSGAIPMAIFDAGIQKFIRDQSFPMQFFDLVTQFGHLTCASKILNHILIKAESNSALPMLGVILSVKLNLAGVPHTSIEFPEALRKSFDEMKMALNKYSREQQTLAQAFVTWLSQLLETSEDLGPEIEAIISSRIRELSRHTEPLEQA